VTTDVALVVNDQDLADFGFVTQTVTGLLDAPGASYPTAKVPGRVGVVRLSRLPETPAREIRVNGLVEAASAAVLDAALGRLKQWLRQGDLELRAGHDLTKFYRGVLTGGVITAADPQFLATAASVQLTFLCVDPRAYGAEALAIGFTAARAPLPLGTAPSEPLIRVMGPAANPVLTYRKASGAVAGVMRFTIT
jgi:hypothetical protein